MIGFGEDGGTAKYTLEEGEYYWKVVPSMETKNGYVFITEDRQSNAGDPQIGLVLQVGDENGTIHVLEALTGSKKASYLISDFLRSAGAYPGKGEPYSLNAEKCLGMGGRCRTRNEAIEGKDYERTRIAEWIPAAVQKPELIAKVKPTDTELALESQRKMEPSQSGGGGGDYTDDIPFM